MDCLFFDLESMVDESRLNLFRNDLSDKAHAAINSIGAGREGGWTGDPDADDALLTEKKSLLGSVTPEYCRVIGLNLGFDEQAPRSGWVGEVRNGGEPLTERDLLEAFWSSVKTAKCIVGFNSIRFDLPAIMVRSALLGVEPTRNLTDLKPWENFHVDLLARRWPYRAGAQFQSLKALRRILSLPIPPGYESVLDMDGGDVGALWVAGEFEKCNRYGCLDIETTRELCRHWGGYFFPAVLGRA